MDLLLAVVFFPLEIVGMMGLVRLVCGRWPTFWSSVFAALAFNVVSNSCFSAFAGFSNSNPIAGYLAASGFTIPVMWLCCWQSLRLDEEPSRVTFEKASLIGSVFSVVSLGSIALAMIGIQLGGTLMKSLAARTVIAPEPVPRMVTSTPVPNAPHEAERPLDQQGEHASATRVNSGAFVLADGVTKCSVPPGWSSRPCTLRHQIGEYWYEAGAATMSLSVFKRGRDVAGIPPTQDIWMATDDQIHDWSIAKYAGGSLQPFLWGRSAVGDRRIIYSYLSDGSPSGVRMLAFQFLTPDSLFVIEGHLIGGGDWFTEREKEMVEFVGSISE